MLKWVIVLCSTLHSSFAALHILQCQLTWSFNTHLCGTMMVVPSRHFFDGSGYCRVAGRGVELSKHALQGGMAP